MCNFTLRNVLKQYLKPKSLRNVCGIALVMAVCVTLLSCDRPRTLASEWVYLSSRNGDIPIPGPSTQQTACLICDVDSDGTNDFIVGCRKKGPSVLWYRRTVSGWEKYVIDSSMLSIEAGGAYHDIDGDGDLDIVFGGDYQSNEVWWWENPNPDYHPTTPWQRHLIKSAGQNQHHDQIFGDFDGDGEKELVFWNQRACTLYLADIPDNPRDAVSWDYHAIFSSSTKKIEGLARCDIDGDGREDIVGGGYWFKYEGGTKYTANVIDKKQKFTRAAVGQLKKGGRPEVVFVTGDGVGRLKWYEWNGDSWVGTDLLGFEVDHGHSLEIADFNADGNQDILCGEMRLCTRFKKRNRDAKIWIFYGDGKGNFTKQQIARGYGIHEAKAGDLDNDGDIDILGKPYNWETPRIDIWLNNVPSKNKLSLDRWQRHIIDAEKPWRTIFITAGDMNGDGYKDIVTGGWWYQNPGTSGGKWVRNPLSSPLHNMALVYDFDGDGDLDVLGTQGKGADSNAQLLWVRNDGTGSFKAFHNVSRGDGDFLQGVAVMPFQHGNILNVALSWHAGGRGIQMLSIPAEPSAARWPLRTITNISQDECVCSGDIDSDGEIDLFLGTMWLRNETSGWSIHAISETEEAPDRNCLVDISRDGKLDAVVGFEAISRKGKLAWYEQGKSSTSLWREHVIDYITGPMSLDVADMDSDGDVDVVVGEHNTKKPNRAKLYIYENTDGRGIHWRIHTIFCGDEHHDGAVTTDIDDDGDLDVISIGWTHKNLLLYENKAINQSQ